MPTDEEEDIGFPVGDSDERELLLSWLSYLRRAAIRKIEGLSEVESRWTPDGRLIPLLGIVNHLTNVAWRWIDGGMLGADVSREEQEFHPGSGLSVSAALAGYRERAKATDAAARRFASLNEPCGWGDSTDLRWVLIHLINETACHAGRADATRELLDGFTGE